MSQRTGGIRRPLANAGVYSLVQRALGAEHVRQAFVRQHLRPSAGERILDLGCGPGDILELLPAVDYVGVDSSHEYVAAGRRRADPRARFVRADVRELSPGALGSFDAVISIGVLHHLDDGAAGDLAKLAASVLEQGGRMATIDPARAEQQTRFARWLIGRDRGQNVRTAADYEAIVARYFGSVSSTVSHDLARVPYTHAILECRGPRRDPPADGR